MFVGVLFFFHARDETLFTHEFELRNGRHAANRLGVVHHFGEHVVALGHATSRDFLWRELRHDTRTHTGTQTHRADRVTSESRDARWRQRRTHVFFVGALRRIEFREAFSNELLHATRRNLRFLFRAAARRSADRALKC